MKRNAANNRLVAAAVGVGFIMSIVAWLVAGCANTGTKRQAAPVGGDRPEPGKALVIFYRESRFQSGAVGYAVRDLDEKPNNPFKALRQPRIGGLPNGSYFVYETTPGEHVFAGSKIAVWQLGLGSLEDAYYYYCWMNLESNTTYYVRADLVGASIGVESSPSLRVVHAEVGAAAIKNLKRVALSR